MRKMISLSIVFLGISLLLAPETFSQIDLDIESGAVFSGYNDVRIPGDTGTLFSLSEELEADPGFSTGFEYSIISMTAII